VCTVTEYDQTEAWPDALTQGSAIDAPINRYLRFPGDLTSASSWRNEKPRLRSWKLEPNPTAIREGAHREKDSTRDNRKHNKKAKRNQVSVLDRYVL
jgi:hypothetical protein